MFRPLPISFWMLPLVADSRRPERSQSTLNSGAHSRRLRAMRKTVPLFLGSSRSFSAVSELKARPQQPLTTKPLARMPCGWNMKSVFFLAILPR